MQGDQAQAEIVQPVSGREQPRGDRFRYDLRPPLPASLRAVLGTRKRPQSDDRRRQGGESLIRKGSRRQLQDLIAQQKKEQRDCESVRDEE